jgi:hypothetical protein
MNATVDVTLTANAGTTVVTDARIGVKSYLSMMPLNSDAAAEISGGTLYIATQKNGSATITHANNGTPDRYFRLLIIG